MIDLPRLDKKKPSVWPFIGFMFLLFIVIAGINRKMNEVPTLEDIADLSCYSRYIDSAQYDAKVTYKEIVELSGQFDIQIKGEMLNGFGVWADTIAYCVWDKDLQKITAFEFM